jgi:hypothetical protein
MNPSSTLPGNTKDIDERLSSKFYSSRRYNPIFLAVTGMGFIAIFLLTQFRILGDPAPQLLYLGLITLLFAIAEIPLLALARQKSGVVVTFLGSVIAGVFAILLTMLWEGIFLLAIVISLPTPVIALRSGMPRKSMLNLLLLMALIIYCSGGCQYRFSGCRRHIVTDNYQHFAEPKVQKHPGPPLNFLYYHRHDSDPHDGSVVCDWRLYK